MRFIARKYRGLRVILKPAYRQIVNGVDTYQSGKTVEFNNGVFETNDPELIQALKACNVYGSMFISDSGEAEVNVLAENTRREAVAKADPFACPYCDFVAKNEGGLRFHIRKHDSEA